MQDNKSKKTVAVILFVIIAFLSCTDVARYFRGIVLHDSSVWSLDSFEIDLSLLKYMSRWHLVGFMAFLAYFVSAITQIIPIFCGIIGIYENKKSISISSVIILDLLSAMAVVSRVTGFGVNRVNIILAPEMPVIIICLIVLNILIFGSKKSVNSSAVQSAPAYQASVNSAPSTDAVEELKKLKSLLDMEVITKEEFEAKKKQLL